MLIWIVMAIVLVVIVLGGFAGRSRQSRAREEAARNAHHKVTHHGKGASGRGAEAGTSPGKGPGAPAQVGRRVISSARCRSGSAAGPRH